MKRFVVKNRLEESMSCSRTEVAIGLAMLLAILMGSLAACGNGNEGGPGVTTTVGATTATATLSWDPVVDPDVQGYKIYYGTQSRSQSGAYPWSLNVGESTEYTVGDLQRGTAYYFAVTAYNTSGLESGYSEEVSATKP